MSLSLSLLLSERHGVRKEGCGTVTCMIMGTTPSRSDYIYTSGYLHHDFYGVSIATHLHFDSLLTKLSKFILETGSWLLQFYRFREEKVNWNFFF